MPGTHWRVQLPEAPPRWRVELAEATPVATLEALNPGDARLYYDDHIREDGLHLLQGSAGTVYRIRVLLDAPAPGGGVSLAFTVGGTAVQDTHYELQTESPLVIPAGQLEGEVRVALLDPGEWSSERLLSVTFSAAQFQVQDERRLWIRTVDLAPTLEFAAASSSGGEGTHPVEAQIGVASGDAATVYHRAVGSGALVEGVDWTITAPGTPQIEPGDVSTEDVASVPLELTITASGAAQVGETVTVTLDHEPADRSQENLWTQTGTLALRDYTPPYATTAGHCEAAGGSWIGGVAPYPLAQGVDVVSQADARHPATKLPFWSIPAGLRKTTPDGDVMEAVLQHESIRRPWALREGQEGARVSGTQSRAVAAKRYVLLSVYVDTLPGVESARDAQFVSLALSVPDRSIEHRVTFWRASDGQTNGIHDSRLWSGGSSVQTVTTDTGTWGLWSKFSLSRDDLWGVEEEEVGGENYTRLWLMHELLVDEIVDAGPTTYPPYHWAHVPLDAAPYVSGTVTEREDIVTSLTDAAVDFGEHPLAIGDVLLNENDQGLMFSAIDGPPPIPSTVFVAKASRGGHINRNEAGDPYSVYKPVNAAGVSTVEELGDLTRASVETGYFRTGDAVEGAGRFTSGSVVGGAPGARGTGLLVWGPLLHTSDVAYPNPPAEYGVPPGATLGKAWPRLGSWPSPRGGAYVPASGGVVEHVFTIT